MVGDTRFWLSVLCLCGAIACSAGGSGSNLRNMAPLGLAGGTAIGGAGAGIAAPGAPGTSTVGGGAANSGAGPGFGNSNVPTMIIGTVGATTKCKSPIVAFVVDGSGSMCEPYGGAGSRWQAVRSALIDKNQGLIYMLQDRGQFGLFVYDGAIDTSVMSTMQGPASTCFSPSTIGRINSMMCLGMQVVAPAKSNAAAIDRAFPRVELGGSTPTDKAMNFQIDQLIAAQVPPWDPMANPQFIILATDGAPNDICPGGAGGDGTVQQAAVLAAVDRAYAAGITTFVISLAGGDAVLEAHLQMVAMHGDPTNPGAHSFSPMNPADLVTALKQLLGTAFGCSIG